MRHHFCSTTVDSRRSPTVDRHLPDREMHGRDARYAERSEASATVICNTTKHGRRPTFVLVNNTVTDCDMSPIKTRPTTVVCVPTKHCRRPRVVLLQNTVADRVFSLHQNKFADRVLCSYKTRSPTMIFCSYKTRSSDYDLWSLHNTGHRP